jgi:DNA-binding MarR family transcriptional regulator
MNELDPVIHAQGRLRIVSVLDTLGPGDSLSFTRIQSILGVTSGGLASHLRKLEDAEYIRVVKTHRGRTPVTYISLTPTARAAFITYKAQLAALMAFPGDVEGDGEGDRGGATVPPPQ